WYLAVLLGALPGPRDSIGLGLQPILARLAGPTRWLGLPDAVAQWWQRLADWVGPPEVYLNNRALILPRPVFGEVSEFVVEPTPFAIIATRALGLWARRRRDATGRSFPVGWAGFGLIVGLPLATLVVLGAPIGFEQPVLRGFNFVGGVRVIPEF